MSKNINETFVDFMKNVKDDNSFYREYKINWVQDGLEIFNSIKNFLNSKYDNLIFHIRNKTDKYPDTENRITLHIYQGDDSDRNKSVDLKWSFIKHNMPYRAVLYIEHPESHNIEHSGDEHILIKNIDDIEKVLADNNILKNKNESMKSIKKFESFVKSLNEEKEEKCECGKCSKEDCKCGPDCDCEECKEKHGGKED